MKFRSLTDSSITASFAEAIMQGQAPDGGLYFPVEIPEIDWQQLDAMPGADQQAVAMTMLWPWLRDEMSESDLRAIIAKAATFPTPIVEVGDKRVLELFHGPTLAFKDVGARYLAAFMGHFNTNADQPVTILVATSGDTGGGIAQAFSGVPHTQVVVLFPKGRVSALQYEQLTRVADNITSLELEGSFDDCQNFVKNAFADKDLTELRLTSANSINMGRLLPQTTYYGSAYAALNRTDLRFIVPTGNLGNLTAGVLAQQLGVPISQFVAANNQNDSIHRYLETGTYTPNTSHTTISNAMDVGAPNNLPRLQELFHHDIDTMRATIASDMVTDEETIETIKRVHAEFGYVLDPHSAVAWAVSDRKPSDLQDLVVATASPLKFAEEIEKHTSIRVDNADQLHALQQKPSRVQQLKADYQVFKQSLVENLL
jgi:threonine synthase